MPPSLIPDAFNTLGNSPILRNNVPRRRFLPIENRILKGPKSTRRSKQKRPRSSKLKRPKTVKRRRNTKRTNTDKNSVGNVQIIEGPIPILRSDVSLRQQEMLPLTFGTLGILPTGVSMQNDIPGSRISQDRTLGGVNLNSNLLDRRLPTQPSGFMDTVPIQRTNLGRQTPVNDIANVPFQPETRPLSTSSNTLNRNFQGNPNIIMQPEWPFSTDFQQENLQFNEFSNARQFVFPPALPEPQRPQTFIPRIRTRSFTTRQFIMPFRGPRWSPFTQRIPMSMNYLPYLSISDSFDIDDNFLFANSFMPTRRKQFLPFMNQQTFGEMPLSPLSNRNVRFGMPFRRRRTFPPTSAPVSFQGSSSFPRVISTPPSVQTNSILPPPSALFQPIFRDDDFGQFIHQPIYNPYIYDTFLSAFNENPRNVTRSERTDSAGVGRKGPDMRTDRQRTEVVRPFQKDKAERIKISRSLGLSNLENQQYIKQNSLRKIKEHQKEKVRRPVWNQNIKRKSVWNQNIKRKPVRNQNIKRKPVWYRGIKRK